MIFVLYKAAINNEREEVAIPDTSCSFKPSSNPLMTDWISSFYKIALINLSFSKPSQHKRASHYILCKYFGKENRKMLWTCQSDNILLQKFFIFIILRIRCERFLTQFTNRFIYIFPFS